MGEPLPRRRGALPEQPPRGREPLRHGARARGLQRRAGLQRGRGPPGALLPEAAQRAPLRARPGEAVTHHRGGRQVLRGDQGRLRVRAQALHGQALLQLRAPREPEPAAQPLPLLAPARAPRGAPVRAPLPRAPLQRALLPRAPPPQEEDEPARGVQLRQRPPGGVRLGAVQLAPLPHGHAARHLFALGVPRARAHAGDALHEQGLPAQLAPLAPRRQHHQL
mmetsp:Transcript_5617/g.16693  ORF Transcript_5617/g.16693 Transcript_5617/m.16693 type:complete len:222 (+) Transcript_5617:2405-3070(+)